jgi:hypothetical protein
MRISLAFLASWQISTSMDNFSSVGRKTRNTSASRLRSKDSNMLRF